MKKKTDDKEAGRRVAKVEKQLHETIASYLIRGLRDPLPGLVTVTRVMMPADLRTAKVYVSVLDYSQSNNSKENGSKVSDEAIEVLTNNAFEIQDHIGHTLKMRYCPKLTFYLDNSTEQVLKVEKILQDLSVEKSKHESKKESE